MGNSQKRGKMNTKERMKAVFSFQIPDKVPLMEVCFWPETVQRWHNEGLPNDAYPTTYFNMDMNNITWMGYSNSFRFEAKVLEETDEYVVSQDENGATVKTWKHSYATPSLTDCMIKTPADWNKHKARLVMDESRIPANIPDTNKHYQDNNIFCFFSSEEPCWSTFRKHGHEQTLINMLDEPELIYDMIGTHAQMVIDACKLMMDKGMRFDGAWLWSDLAYKNGLLFSPKTYRELILPHHSKVFEFFNQNNIPSVMHCDGDVREYIPLLIEAGLTAIQPLEARAGNDVRELKKIYGDKIIFVGNINADVMGGTKEEIEFEVRTKVSTAKQNGGYIFHSDHSVPPSVSFENYCYVIELVEKYGKY
jgi:uroporphyrinogen decarboxylase